MSFTNPTAVQTPRPGRDAAGDICRREFIRTAGIGCAGGLALLREVWAADKPGPPLKVVVVGAGLAGLAAAYELEAKGHEVVLLEADARAGGRVKTHRFADGGYGELGAMRIPTGHDLTRHYVKLFDLRLRPFVSDNPAAYYHIRGTKVRARDVGRLAGLFKLAADEKAGTPSQLWERAVTRRWKKLTAEQRADLFSTRPATKAVLELDHLTVRQLFTEAGLSDEAIEYLGTCSAEEGLQHTAATELLRDETLDVYSKPLDEIEGGMDRLPRAFVDRLRAKPRFGCEVVAITQDAGRKVVRAAYREKGRDAAVEGDYLLCTIPFPVLDRVKITPPFSAEKRRAIRVLNYDSGAKMLLRTKQRFWESGDGIYGGGTITDLPTGMTFYPSDNATLERAGNETVVKGRDPAVSARPGVLLASYNWGMAARPIAAGDPAGVAADVVRQVATVHPELAADGMVLDSAFWSWDQHRWSAGAYAWFLPGQHTELYRHVIEPEGRVFIAGEHASLSHSWMQGALESALRAVKEMLNHT